MFGHADWQHLISNMSLVILLGPIIESRYGFRVLALVITITNWFAKIRDLAVSMGYAAKPKDYKKNPEDYKGQKVVR